MAKSAVAFFAKRFIEVDEEITIDYGGGNAATKSQREVVDPLGSQSIVPFYQNALRFMVLRKAFAPT
ncbi:hypothetical protein F444_20147 [Phytophthora nicotianae P1976]|uniref:SET domain-containing protein n=1 Tax=Phytophthora nicotianae P1976 TaxID=1317066 RepID=A0A080Z5K8_PHYNI|nr:hypothetical protein F444_20147 [Phytophthora nicotianae P1976]